LEKVEADFKKMKWLIISDFPNYSISI
jgi:hypothetical protein